MAKITDIAHPGMTGYIQCANPARYDPAYADAEGLWQAFTVQAGDYWNGPSGSEARAKRERCEFRQGWDVDGCEAAGTVVEFEGEAKNAPGYPFFSPKQTWLQIFDLGKSYPLAFLRLEGEAMTLLVNYKRKDGKSQSWAQTFPVPFTPGRALKWRMRVGLIPGNASLRFEVDGAVVCDIRGDKDLVQPGSALFYFKGGVYRSGMEAYPNAPEQTVLHRGWRRSLVRAAAAPVPGPVGPVPPAPVPATPAPQPPAPAPAPVAAAVPRALIEWVDANENAARDVLAEIQRAGLPHADLAQAAIAAQTALLNALKAVR